MPKGVYPRPRVRERFDRFVDKTGDCWLWTGGRTGANYGAFTYKVGGKQRVVGAHRIAVVFDGRRIPFGMEVIHRCDNPPCVRPDHLIVGTHAQNMTDMLDKGRKWAPRSEDHHWSRLTLEQVRAIRSRPFDDQAALAAEFGVSQPTISRVIARQTWRKAA